MICRSCAVRLSALRASKPLSPLPQPQLRPRYNSSSATAAARGPASAGHEGPPAATSTSAAQPFSTSQTPAGKKDLPASSTPVVKSSVPAGTPLKGLGYLKNKDPPIALEDKDYPDWLWEILDEKKAAKEGGGGGGSEGDAYAKSKKQRKLAAKAARKAAKENPGLLEPKVPLQHQTVDLPGGDGSVEASLDAASARRELTQAMRHSRKKDIKEANFLKGMR